MTYYTILKTPLDDLLLTANESALTGIFFANCDHAPAKHKDWTHDPKHPVLRQAADELREYFAGKRTTFSVPVHFAGTDFQDRIWKEIARIPHGQTISYSELAERAGAPQAVRAAGLNTGKNPLSIIVPCHRVMGKNGKITGYAGGLKRKRFLLELENPESKLF